MFKYEPNMVRDIQQCPNHGLGSLRAPPQIFLKLKKIN